MTDLDKIAQEKRKAVLNDLKAKPKQIEINGALVDIYPLSLDNVDIIADLKGAKDSNKEDEQINVIKRLVVATLKESFPDASEKEILSLPLKLLEDLTDVILEVNGVSGKAGGSSNPKAGSQ